ncbi:MAG: quinone-dependent dihydroorotate dehydrogenase [Chloroflexota bacterium]
MLPDWRALAYRAARPILFGFDPERIHHLMLRALRGAGAHPVGRAVAARLGGVSADGSASLQLMGLRFRNRVGVGAGFDKDAVALPGWAALGIGFMEVGTVTPLPQPGNPRPRLFRLTADDALINRMGFNNAGAAALARRVMLARRALPDGFVVGVNIGRGRDTDPDDAIEDYLACHRLVAPVADYLAINVSSPNTPGLRDLQDPRRLERLLETLADAGETGGFRRPLLVKLAPDLGAEELDELLRMLVDSPAAGVILANTTVRRERLRSLRALAAEAGGLSGDPLWDETQRLIERAREIGQARLVILASGGISTAERAAAAVATGADLVQLWTGLVYQGPSLIGQAVRATH